MQSTKFYLMAIAMVLVTIFTIVLIVSYALSEAMLTKVVEWYMIFMGGVGGTFTVAKTLQNVNEDIKIKRLLNDEEPEVK